MIREFGGKIITGQESDIKDEINWVLGEPWLGKRKEKKRKDSLFNMDHHQSHHYFMPPCGKEMKGDRKEENVKQIN